MPPLRPRRRVLRQGSLQPSSLFVTSDITQRGQMVGSLQQEFPTNCDQAQVEPQGFGGDNSHDFSGFSEPFGESAPFVACAKSALAYLRHFIDSRFFPFPFASLLSFPRWPEIPFVFSDPRIYRGALRLPTVRPTNIVSRNWRFPFW